MLETAGIDRALVDRAAGDGAPEWLAASRRDAWQTFEREPLPHWRRSSYWTTSIKELRLEELRGDASATPVDGRDGLPKQVREAVEAQDPAGLVVQGNGTTIYADLDVELAERGVVICPLEQAVRERPELVERFYMRRLSAAEGKFAAATAALWSGGAFIYVPPDLKLERPLMVVYTIDEGQVAQFAHTLAVADRHADFALREFDLAGPIDGQALHSGAFELYLEDGARCDLASFQDWGPSEVFDISTKRVTVGRDANVSWVPVHLGGHLTKQTLEIVTAEPGAGMSHKGIYFAEDDEHLDLYSVDNHEVGPTTGDTIWKGVLTGAARASYEGLIRIAPGAQQSHTFLQTHTMLLSPRARADAIPSLRVEADDVSASHGGTVGEVDEDQLFYMMSRGLDRLEAVRLVVEGYFEPIISEIADPGLQRLCRERIAAKLASAATDVEEYASHERMGARA